MVSRLRPRPGWSGPALAWIPVVLPALVVATVVILAIGPGLAPDVGFWDTGEFQTILPILGTAHPTGYQTYVILGFVANLLLTPLGEPAFRMNVLSLLSVALAAAVAVRLAIRLTGNVAIAMAVGLGLALTPDVWRIGTHADPHTLHLALVAILFSLLLRWEHARRDGDPRADRWLVAAAVVFGLSVGNHSLTLLLALPVGLYVLSVFPGIVRNPRLVAACAGALALTVVLVYLELPLRAGPFRAPLVYGKPDTWAGFWYVALAEQFRGSLVEPLGDLAGKFRELVDLAVGQFGFVAALIPAGFLTTLVRYPRFALLTGVSMLITTVFNAAYTNADISRYYLGPILWAWLWLAVLAGTIFDQVTGGAPEVAKRPEGVVGPLAQVGRPPLGSIGIAAVLAVALLVPSIGAFGLRAELANEHSDTSARRWVTAALKKFEPDAVVVSWWSTSTVLWYAQYVDHLRSDITVIDDRTRLDLGYGEATDVIARFLGKRPVYVIRANNRDLNKVLAVFDLTRVTTSPAKDVYIVVGLRGSGG